MNALKNRWPWCLAAKRCKGPAWRIALERLAEGLGKRLKNRWPWWLAAKTCKGPAWRVALERLAEGLKGLGGFRAGKRQP